MDLLGKIESLLSTKSHEQQAALKKLAAIGQLRSLETFESPLFDTLLEKLVEIDSFYREIGGLAGYQEKILELLKQKETSREEIVYHPPSWIDISEETEEVWEAIFAGLEALPQMAEMVPLGGAADRLHLIDEKTGYELPAAKLSFAGYPLIATLIRDLQACEYLYYKLYGKQVTVPLALMTSEEKNNHRHIERLMEETNWFDRPKESYRFFMQPLVPVVSESGDWCWIGPCKPLMKPGGHGAIWKLARDRGVFDWLEKRGCKKALIRQINNPIAGVDYGILAFTGMGVAKEKVFGFASCPRVSHAAEGVNVVVEKNGEIVLTNVEYCDFVKAGIEDLLNRESHRFSSNTNILFADLKALKEAVERCPYPGLLINLKKISYVDAEGEKKEAMLARLESTMQNIADVFVEKKRDSLQTEKTFVTYNQRSKTISTAKKGYIPGGSLQETPEKCFYDLSELNRELLARRCGWDVPEGRGLEEYLSRGPEALFLYHPALGPLYSIISQKLRGGRIGVGAELQLEIGDIDCEGLDLEGSLLVRAEQVTGHFENGLWYSEKTGRCVIRNVVVRNRGVIKKLGLQDSKNKRNINPDEKLQKIFGGKKAVNMFEMTKLVNKHLS